MLFKNLNLNIAQNSMGICVVKMKRRLSCNALQQMNDLRNKQIYFRNDGIYCLLKQLNVNN